MKRYEKMSKEEIIEIINSTKKCNTCLIEKECPRFIHLTCSGTLRSWLNEEIEMIPRAWKFKTVEEVVEAQKEYCLERNCEECEYSAGKNNWTNCWMSWLYGEEEK